MLVRPTLRSWLSIRPERVSAMISCHLCMRSVEAGSYLRRISVSSQADPRTFGCILGD